MQRRGENDTLKTTVLKHPPQRGWKTLSLLDFSELFLTCRWFYFISLFPRIDSKGSKKQRETFTIWFEHTFRIISLSLTYPLSILYSNFFSFFFPHFIVVVVMYKDYPLFSSDAVSFSPALTESYNPRDILWWKGQKCSITLFLSFLYGSPSKSNHPLSLFLNDRRLEKTREKRIDEENEQQIEEWFVSREKSSCWLTHSKLLLAMFVCVTIRRCIRK